MGALCCKKQYQRRLVRVLAVLAPAALFLVCLVSLAGQANAESSRTVRINEIMAKNLSGLQGQDGQPVDWVELYNASEQPVSLKGAGLSNKAGDAYVWVFPEYILAPGEYLVVYADGLDCADETGFHTPFQIRDYLIKKYEAEKEKDKELKEALEAVRKYPEYRQQSIKIQEKLENEIQELRKAQDEHTCRLLQMEENSQRRERNKLRDRLLQNYRYYTSKEHNPHQEWTRMESETFWECFADYENMNGNGYMHSVVQPEMNLLGIIEMDDASGIAELMHSRK